MRESQLNQCERYFSRMIKNKSNVLFSLFKYLSKKKESWYELYIFDCSIEFDMLMNLFLIMIRLFE
jgi:hypothetical protein